MVISNKIIDKVLICVGSSTKDELKQKRNHVLNKLIDIRLTINREKCELDGDTISYLGYQISEDAIAPETKLIKRIFSGIYNLIKKNI